MRFSMLFEIDKPILPVDYRSGFISLLKKSYEIACRQAYAKLYEANTLKPFTFSVYFGNRSRIQNNKVLINADNFMLNFSTASLELGTYFYNGLLRIKKDLRQYPLFDTQICLKDVQLKREAQIKEETVVFKTLSPFLVRDYENKDKYLRPADESFAAQLNHIVSECSIAFLGSPSEIEFMDIKTSTLPVYHNLGNSPTAPPIDAIKGVFALKGTPEILNMIYQIGIGSRRSQGFGMLEVMR